MEELVYVKNKKGWICKDRQGRSATGLTKEIARNQYWLKYKTSQMHDVGYDMSEFNNKYGVYNE